MAGEWEDNEYWSSMVNGGRISIEGADYFIAAGFEDEDSLLGIPTDSVLIIRDGDSGEWWFEVNGIQITDKFDDERNAIVWDIYDFWSTEFEDPPEKDIDSPKGKGSQ